MISREAMFERLWQETGLSADDRAGEIIINGDDPVVPSKHRLGVASAIGLSLHGASTAAVWKARTGEGQNVSVDVALAAVPGLQTINFTRIGPHPMTVGQIVDEEVNFFRTRDDRRIFLWRLPIYPHLTRRLLRELDCSILPASIAKAVAERDGEELEDAIAKAGAIAAVCRNAAEWRAHPQGAWLQTRPVIDIVKTGESEPVPFTASPDRPLSGVRVLDCTHVIAGPTTSALLAGDGADVLRITKPWADEHPALTLGTGMGKRNAVLNYDREDDAETLRELARQGDVLVQSWRPGSLDAKGLGAQQLAETAPGLIYVSVSCYGSEGPWAGRRGFEQLGQTACGLAGEEGTPDKPRLASTGTLNDYLVAYFAATGVKAALLRRAREGGSYHVRVSLARSSMFVQDLGPLDPALQAKAPDKLPMPPASAFYEMESAYGHLSLARPPVELSATPPRWDLPPVPPGFHQPVWLER